MCDPCARLGKNQNEFLKKVLSEEEFREFFGFPSE